MEDTSPIQINFTDFWHERTPEAIHGNPLFQLISKWFDLELSSSPDFLVYSCFGHRHLRHACTRIFYTGENVRPDYRLCDHAFTFDRIDDPKHRRLPLYRFYLSEDDSRHVATRHQQADQLATTPRDFCSFVVTNPDNPVRAEFFHLLSTYKQVNSGGRLLNNVGGPVGEKRAFLRRHKFNIAFENSSHPGYVTEKIVEAFATDTIPIYWGHPDVVRDFNPEAFVNCHDFPDLASVVDQVRRIDQDPILHARYLRAPIFPGGRRDRNDYLEDEPIRQRFEQIFRSGPRSHPFRHLHKFGYLRRVVERRWHFLCDATRRRLNLH